MKILIFRILPTVFISCIFAGFCEAQDRFFNAYASLGTNFCQVDGDHFSGYNKVGFHAGIGIYHDYNENWSGGFELLYSTKGSKRRIDPEDVNPQIFILSAQYVEMPLIVGYKLSKLKKLSFQGGLSLGVNVGGTVDDGVVTEANFKKSEIAIQLGGRYMLNDHLQVQIRHSNSLFRIGDQYQNGSNIFYRVGLFNRLYMIGVTYHL